MKLFTWKYGRVTPGLSVVEDQALGDLVLLGEVGRGRKALKIGLSKAETPPVTVEMTGNRVVKEATLNQAQGGSWFLRKEEATTPHVGVRVCSKWVYTKHSIGGVYTAAEWDLKKARELLIKEDRHEEAWRLDEEIKRVASWAPDVCGTGAEGAAGRCEQWEDRLVVLHPGERIVVRPTGGHKTGAWVIYFTPGADAPETMTLADWVVREDLAQS